MMQETVKYAGGYTDTLTIGTKQLIICRNNDTNGNGLFEVSVFCLVHKQVLVNGLSNIDWQTLVNVINDLTAKAANDETA